MKKFYKISLKILTVLCAIIITWFFVYFLRGEEFSLTFSDRVFASYFPQILVFSAGVSIYLLFICQVKSKFQWWKKLLILMFGFLIATIPFLLYHGYFQYQNGFWNRKTIYSKGLYFNKLNQSEKIKIIEFKLNKEVHSDTIHSKQVTPYFELQNPVKIKKAENTDWEIYK